MVWEIIRDGGGVSSGDEGWKLCAGFALVVGYLRRVFQEGFGELVGGWVVMRFGFFVLGNLGWTSFGGEGG